MFRAGAVVTAEGVVAGAVSGVDSAGAAEAPEAPAVVAILRQLRACGKPRGTS